MKNYETNSLAQAMLAGSRSGGKGGGVQKKEWDGGEPKEHPQTSKEPMTRTSQDHSFKGTTKSKQE